MRSNVKNETDKESAPSSFAAVGAAAAADAGDELT